jgi:hypothetical protein
LPFWALAAEADSAEADNTARLMDSDKIARRIKTSFKGGQAEKAFAPV